MAGAFEGPILSLRFVQLVDGRKILQFNRGSEWETPETVPQHRLIRTEEAELLQAVGVQHRDNGDGV